MSTPATRKHTTPSRSKLAMSSSSTNVESAAGLARRLRRMKRRLFLRAVLAEDNGLAKPDRVHSKSKPVETGNKTTSTIALLAHRDAERKAQLTSKPSPQKEEEVVVNDDEEASRTSEQDEERASQDYQESGKKKEEDWESEEEDRDDEFTDASPRSVRLVRYHFPKVVKNRDLMPSFDPEASVLSLPELVEASSTYSGLSSSSSSSLMSSSSSTMGQPWSALSSTYSTLSFCSALEGIDEYQCNVNGSIRRQADSD